jgi:methionyl aminopeptidase
MKINSNAPQSDFVIYQNDIFLQNQRIAGKVAAGAISLLENLVKEKTKLTMIELNDLAEKYIIDNDCIPTFKGYHGFPAGVCISINKQLVHGIPTDYILQEGDLVSFDLGATYKEAIADTAATFIYGEPKLDEHRDMINTAELCLQNAIEAIDIGKRIGCIGNAIYRTATDRGYKVITSHGGHGISIYNDKGVPHAYPFVSNKDEKTNGIRIQPGMTIAIEPLLTLSSGQTYTTVGLDKWTVQTEMLNCHCEHTVFIHSDKVEVITHRV